MWTQLDREDYLSELLRLEGRCAVSETCLGCKLQLARLRCEDCFGLHMYCQECMVTRHSELPLHRLRVRGNEHRCIYLCLWQEWNGTYFERKTLKELGLNVQLGHPIGEQCHRPRSVPKDEFVVLHNNGIHVVCLAFCGCETAETLSRQLLRIRWFPATSEIGRAHVWTPVTP